MELDRFIRELATKGDSEKFKSFRVEIRLQDKQNPFKYCVVSRLTGT